MIVSAHCTLWNKTPREGGFLIIGSLLEVDPEPAKMFHARAWVAQTGPFCQKGPLADSSGWRRCSKTCCNEALQLRYIIKVFVLLVRGPSTKDSFCWMSMNSLYRVQPGQVLPNFQPIEAGTRTPEVIKYLFYFPQCLMWWKQELYLVKILGSVVAECDFSSAAKISFKPPPFCPS